MTAQDKRVTIELSWRMKAAEWLTNRAELAMLPQIVEATAEQSGLSRAQIEADMSGVAFVLRQAAHGLMEEVEEIRRGEPTPGQMTFEEVTE